MQYNTMKQNSYILSFANILSFILYMVQIKCVHIKKVCLLSIGLFSLVSCTIKEYNEENFVAPAINILSTKITSENTCELELKINIGDGASIKEAYISLWDMTTENAEPEEIPIELTEEKEQTHKLTIKVSEKKHDYKVKVILRSEKNDFSSSPQIIRFSDRLAQGVNYIDLYISGADLSQYYVDEANKVGMNLERGERFSFIVYYSKLPSADTKTEIKLNGTIPIKTEISYSGSMEDDHVLGFGYLPDNIVPGIYSVHVYLNDKEYILDYKINVLPGISKNIYLSNMPYSITAIWPPTVSFMKGNEIYYLHNDFNPLKMLIYNLESNTWREKNADPLSAPYQVSVFGKVDHYILMYYISEDNATRKMALFDFDESKDMWIKISDYPGMATRGVIAFKINSKIYIGGGARDGYNKYGYFETTENLKDFWEYDITNDKWIQKNNLPYNTRYDGYINSCCMSPDRGYIFSRFLELWEYSPLNDSWKKLNSLRGGPIPRFYSKLLYNQDKLYLVGGEAYYNFRYNLRDIWEYDLKTQCWRLIDLFDAYFKDADVQTFMYKNKIRIGYSAILYEKKPLFVEVELP